MKKSFLTIVIILIFASSTKAQFIKNVLEKLESDYDTAYIYLFPRRILIKPIALYRDFSFKVNPVSLGGYNKALNIRYRPNVNQYVGLGLNYKNFQLQFIRKIPSTYRDVAKFGKTDYTDLNIWYFLLSKIYKFLRKKCFWKCS